MYLHSVFHLFSYNMPSQALNIKEKVKKGESLLEWLIKVYVELGFELTEQLVENFATFLVKNCSKGPDK